MDIEHEKKAFLKEFGQDYGYPDASKNIDEIRDTEFKRLKDMVYLDHAGATLYSELQMKNIFQDLNSTLYGNPHSQSSCSIMTVDVVGEARQKILNFFNASPGEYKCIFTSGATAALKLVGEAFPWSRQSTFAYAMENHNSVLGIREYALREGAAAVALDSEDFSKPDQWGCGKSAFKIMPHSVQKRDETVYRKTDETGDIYNLFAFPSECNFSGNKFNLDLVNVVKEGAYEIPGTLTSHSGQWMVLIDAAKGSATSPPDLSKYKADFVVVSFYKLFGYPTGIGALIARNEAAKLLKKTYFSGGTVAASIADIDFHKRRDGVEEYFEDGTLPFVSIASLKHGFAILDALSMSAIFRHTISLASYTRKKLINFRHINGSPVCALYGVNGPELLHNEMGPIVAFNLRRPDGSWFGYREVEKLASLSNIQLRTGCFCNPGACAKHLGLSHSDLRSNFEAGHVCWDDCDILHGKPTGAVRVSFGYMSTFEDAMKFLKFIKSSFVSMAPEPSYLDFCSQPFHPPTKGVEKVTARCFLKSISIYPIKSCAGFTVESWPLSSTGLLYDREWLLMSLSGEFFTQKKVPEMGFITAEVDLKSGLLTVLSPHCKEKLQVELKPGQSIAERSEIQGYPSEVNNWFSKALGRPCALVRNVCAVENPMWSSRNLIRGMHRDMSTKLNFVNEAQLLLISEESVTDLNSRLRSKLHNGSSYPVTEVSPSRFRPNLVVHGGNPYEEDEWRSLKIGQTYFVSMGGCNRCQMINMTPVDGAVHRSNEPLATLASYRRVKGKIHFGTLLKLGDNFEQDEWLSVGQELIINPD